MRRAVFFLATASVLRVPATGVGAAPDAGDAPAPARIQGNCGTTALSVIFWPKGHSAVSFLGQQWFPEFRLPHVEVYANKGGATYLPKNQLAYAGTDRKNMLVPACRRVAALQTFNVLAGQAARAKTQFTCSFAKPAHIQIRSVAGAGVRAELYLIEPPNKLVLRAQIAPQGSNVSYAFGKCSRANVPFG